jgi:N-methylhydantoinase B
LSFTKSASYCAIRSILPANIPNNEGVFRAIEVTAPPRTIANAVLPAACAARGLTGFRMVDCMFGALAQMLPDKVFACPTAATPGSRSAAGTRTGGRSSMSISPVALWGGRPYADGLDGNSNIYANMASQSIEVTETEQPIEITAYEFIRDAMGPGKFRGGAPFRRDYRFLAEEGILQVRSDRRDSALTGSMAARPASRR